MGRRTYQWCCLAQSYSSARLTRIFRILLPIRATIVISRRLRPTHFNMNDHLGAEYLNIAASSRAGKVLPIRSRKRRADGLDAARTACGAGRPSMGVRGQQGRRHGPGRGSARVSCSSAQESSSCRRWPGADQAFWAWADGRAIRSWVLVDFFLWFQFTHDSWMVLLALDLLVAGSAGANRSVSS